MLPKRRSIEKKRPHLNHNSRGTIRITTFCALALIVIVVTAASVNRAQLFHSESASLSIYVLGVGATAASAETQYAQSWKFADEFLRKHDLYANKIRLTAPEVIRAVEPRSLTVTFTKERRIDIYAKSWDQLMAYHDSISLMQPRAAYVTAELPRTIATCAGPLQFVRSDDYPIGMHPVAIVLHAMLLAMAAISIWNIVDQSQVSWALVLLIALGTAVLLGRWIVVTRSQWATVFS